ncbi:MAG: ferritin family protein [Firmicutes bacterium]|nr:ferritin family protein [Bacillota bacterium]
MITIGDKELLTLKRAVLNEEEGYQFYTLAAQQTRDEATKSAFAFLAEEESKHKSWLLELYRQKANPLKPAPILEYSSPGVFRPANAKTESGSLEVSVYGIGILMEKASREFYRQAAEEAESEELKAVYLHLAEWETGHLEMLEKIYEQLKEDWWDQQGFSPS